MTAKLNEVQAAIAEQLGMIRENGVACFVQICEKPQ